MHTQYLLIYYLYTQSCRLRTQQRLETHSSNDEEVKHTTTVLPCICIPILILTLICTQAVGREWGVLWRIGLTIEPIDLSDLSALVVSSQENYFIWVHGLESEELCKCLQTVVASVHKVTLQLRDAEYLGPLSPLNFHYHKHIGSVWDFSSRLKQLLQVIEL